MHALIVIAMLGQCQGGACLAPRLAWPPVGRVLVIAPHVEANADGCSPLCTCGCNEGLECRCGNVPPRKAEAVRARVDDWHALERELPTGVDCSRLSRVPRYTIDGREVTEGAARQAIEQLADDSAKPFLTLIGDEVARKALRSVLEREAWLVPLVRLQDYPPDHWRMHKHSAAGLTAYLQEPGGRVLLRAAGLTEAGVSDLLARLKDRLGLGPKAPPKTPGPDGGSPGVPRGWPWRVLVGGGAGLILILLLMRR
jgi:hypothetical protein